MFKDYKLYFLTSSNEIQQIIRDLNVKIFGKKDIINELDFHGF
jgi:hypothetical protein